MILTVTVVCLCGSQLTRFYVILQSVPGSPTSKRMPLTTNRITLLKEWLEHNGFRKIQRYNLSVINYVNTYIKTLLYLILDSFPNLNVHSLNSSKLYISY